MTNFWFFLVIAAVGGLLTILAPCILAVLPILLGATLGNKNKWRPVLIVLGLSVSFSVFGLAFSYLTNLLGLSNNTIRNIALIFLGIFALAMIFPLWFEKFFYGVKSFFSRFFPTSNLPENLKTKKESLWGAFVLGCSLGLVWAPCAGPILGAILTLAIAQANIWKVGLLMLAYSLGAGVPMLIIAYGGNWILKKLNLIKKYGATIQKIAGVLVLISVILIATGLDIAVETSLFNLFPNLGMVEQNLLQQIKPMNPMQTIQNMDENKKAIDQSRSAVAKMLKDLGPAPEIVGINNWINSDPLKLADLKGKVVLVDFWTYSCINCQRTLPYLTKWDAKYKDQGLVIIGVHTPEFAFEKDLENVQRAVRVAGINYPVALDNDHGTWNNYNNEYWPAEYFIDKKGEIRFTHFGEGQYDEKEMVIQYLLNEDNADMAVGKDLAANQVTDTTDFSKILSPETYLGSKRSDPSLFKLGGKWEAQDEFIQPSSAVATITINFSASKVNLVMAPGKEGVPGKLKLLLNGKQLDESSRGADVAVDGTVSVGVDRLYNLVDKHLNYGPGELVLQFESDFPTQAYAFTFG